MVDEDGGEPAVPTGDFGLTPFIGPTVPGPDEESKALDGVDASEELEAVSAPDLPPGEDEIPPAPLWAMQSRMHSLRRREPGEEGRIRRRLGDDDDALYVFDDGLDHCMIGRRVGRAPDGCVYCLVARTALENYADIVAGDLDVTEAFSDARDISLCGVFEQEAASGNVLLVQHYRRPRDIPAEYLPASPFIEFTDEPDPDAED